MNAAYDVVVIGGGPAGMAAALEAAASGASVALTERNDRLGGILPQCIHTGFGLEIFNEELTGPEYAARYVMMLEDTGVDVILDAMVLQIEAGGAPGAHKVPGMHKVHAVSRATGYQVYEADAVVLAMGCRERTRGAISIPGTRPSGVLTAGTAQRYVNMEGYMPGRRVVILGSGDIGLIMARRMTLEGAKVLACVELLPFSGGLTRNIVQCLNDYDIPLLLSHTVTEIRGDARLTGVTVAAVDESRAPIPGTEVDYDCDTLLLSVGLIPENELSRAAGVAMDARTNGAVVYENNETELPGVFACGNVLHVHDLVDFVSAEAARAGTAAAEYVLHGGAAAGETALCLLPGAGVGYCVPQKIRPARVAKAAEIFFRATRVFGESSVVLTCGGEKLASFARERMAPGEMERVLLPKVILEKASGDITVTVREH